MDPIKLKHHQLIPIEFMKTNRGLILFHSTGSGKTLTSLFSVYQFTNDIIIIGPKSSKKAFFDNIKKAQLNENRVTFYSYTKIKIMLQNDLNIFENKSVIADEAHNLRSETIDNLSVISALSLAYKVVLLTATPVINYLNDLAVLVNIAKNKDVLPTEKVMFITLYYDMENNTILNENILKDKLSNCISKYENIDTINYPSFKVEKIDCVMDDYQLKEYMGYVKKILYNGENKDDLLNVDFDLLGGRKKNNFLAATRQLSNVASGHEISPKIKQIYEVMMKGPFPVIVYSNFLKNGIYLIARLLEKTNIEYKVISGNTTSDRIVSIVNNYNNDRYQVLLISSAGSESLDLKKTRQIHIMEPHWNEAKIVQIIGRAVRFKSHSDLPENERNVVIYRWISVFPKKIMNLSADQHLMQLSEKKQLISEKFNKLIEDVSIEKNGIVINYGGYYDEYKKEYNEIKNKENVVVL